MAGMQASASAEEIIQAVDTTAEVTVMAVGQDVIAV